MDAIPISLKRAIGAGIGLFIALIGFANGGLVKSGQGTVLTLGNVHSLSTFVFAVGFVLTAWLLSRKTKGALLWGILLTTGLAMAVNSFWGNGRAFGAAAVIPQQWFDLPQGLVGPGAILGRVDFGFISKLGWVSALLVTFSILLSDFFDTMGTVVGVGEEGGFLDKDGKLPRIKRVLIVDSLGAAFGGLANASSNTTYIESAAGVAEGGRTGLTSVVVGLLFLFSMFLNPIASIVPKEATAPVLVLVGFFMMTMVQEIPWQDYEEAIPAFVTILMMPFTYSITNGIGAGLITYVLIKLLRRKFRELHPLTVGVSLAFVVHFLYSAS
jgi:AGZA family xanthine/uracil permease-like MFS transporter